MTTLKEQEDLFILLGERIKKKTECFIIGGSAMIYYKAKVFTKDIDIVLKTEKDRETIKKTLEKLGFIKKDPKILYFDKKNTPILMSRGNDRFDLFNKKIISFQLTETIMQRSKKVYEYNNLIANIISPEDIILLKCATERAGDRQDAKEIIENYNIDWEIIIKEAEHQSDIGEDKFVVYLYSFLEELKQDLKVEIPKDIIKKLRKATDKILSKGIKVNVTDMTKK